MVTLSEDDCRVDSFSISWSSPAQSVCQGISYNITLLVLDNERYEILATYTVNVTYHNFTGLNSSTSYSVEVMPIYNGFEGNISSITVRTKDQPSSTVIISTYVAMHVLLISTVPLKGNAVLLTRHSQEYHSQSCQVYKL